MIFIQLHQTNGDHIVDFQFIITVLAVLNMLKETFQLLICQFLFNKSRNHPLYIMTLHPAIPPFICLVILYTIFFKK